jgi:hypothetical protein
LRRPAIALVPAITIVAAALLIEGCGDRAATAPPAAKVRDSLAKKLSTMTPDQRTEYMHQHPEALGALSGTAPDSKTP